MKQFKIADWHRSYLEVQCGDISHLIPDRAEWDRAYDSRIEQVYQSMKSSLPENVNAILDIGGGLSGIGARLCEHYEGKPLIAVLDGKNTLAVVDKHNQPFNNATATQNFLHVNGVRNQWFYSPEDEITHSFDLIISTQAWCFHIAPEVYLDKVKKALRPGGTLIVDLRKGKPEWAKALADAFGLGGMRVHCLAEAVKWGRVVVRSVE